MKKIISFTTLILILSCNNSSKIDEIENLNEKQMRVLNIEQFSANGVTSFAYYLYISDITLSDSTLVKIAQDYINDLTTNKPVFVIKFVNSNDGFSQSPEDNDLDEIRKNTFAKLNYSDTFGPKQGELKKITRYNKK